MNNKITDIAKAAMVSPATVSRVFGKHPYVKDDVRKRVLDIARKLNYSPKFGVSKNTFAILSAGEGEMSIGNFEVLAIEAISREFFKHDCNIQIISKNNLPFIHNNTFQGIIDLSRPSDSSFPISGVPHITLNHLLPKVHSVATDHMQGIELAINFLISKGHKKIAFICGEAENWGNLERIKGFKKGLSDNNMKFNKNLLGIVSENNIVEVTAKIIKEKVTAIIISSEGLGLRLNYALYLLDKKVPDDVSVISFEDKNISQFLIPPHTTINQNLDKLAKTVVDTIIKIRDSKNKTTIKNIILKNELIERESVKDLLAF